MTWGKEPQTKPSGYNQHVFLPGERVKLKGAGPGVTGEVIGVAGRSLLDTYIVLLDNPLPNWPWKAVTRTSNEMEKL